MIKKYFIILWFLLAPVQSANFSFLHIPIQEEGRIKPLDSFARNQLLKIYGKNKLTIYDESDKKYKISAIDWLYSILKQEPSSLNQTIFKIENPAVVNALNLEITKNLTYSFHQINNGLNQKINQKLIQKLIQSDKEFLTLVEKQILDLHIKRNLFIELYNSASCIVPIMTISDSMLADAFNIKQNTSISYSYYLRNQINIHHNLQKLINSIDDKDADNNTFYELKIIMDAISIFENEIFMRNHSSKIKSSDILNLESNPI